jgi:hypothetical protein
MKIDQAKAQTGWPLVWRAPNRTLARPVVMRWVRVVLALLLLGSGSIPTATARRQAVAYAVAGWMYDLMGYEVTALRAKVHALNERPADRLAPDQATALVRDYMVRAHEIGRVEGELRRMASTGALMAVGDSGLASRLQELRAAQAAVRPTVEAVIEQQVTVVLSDAGFGVGGVVWPPVQFAFVEPPKKLVVSRRDEIATTNSHMLAPEMPLNVIEEAEASIDALPNASAYVTEIGGLGAYPTMVVDQASLEWVLSTVAHEWVHNYLVFYPLGWRYFVSQELTTMNETVAEIVGNEIGSAVLARNYPDLVPPPRPAGEELLPAEAPEFDINAEMRATRLEVDRLLAAGEVVQAERYMETRRLFFVEHGYPLRVLNQAFFAFHGSYGTSPASTDPIGPLLRSLRATLPGVADFLKTVRWYTTPDELTHDLTRGLPVQAP